MSCLYLRNLPRRPGSRSNYIRVLLKHINEKNNYAVDYGLPLPRHELIGNGEAQPLDTDNGIVDISVSKSFKMTSQCFVTFVDEEHASMFKARGLKIHGREINIQWAKKNSLMGLALESTEILQSALASRRRRLNKDQLLLRRRQRRLRSKLRAKGLSKEEIAAATTKGPSRALRKRENRKSESNSKLNNKVVTSENPPNKILLVQNLPQDVTLPQVEPLFAGDGLVEIRLVAVRRVAFVEYDSLQHATAKRNQLTVSHNWNGHTISIGYAK